MPCHCAEKSANLAQADFAHQHAIILKPNNLRRPDPKMDYRVFERYSEKLFLAAGLAQNNFFCQSKVSFCSF